MACHAADGDPSALTRCPRGEREDRRPVETVLAMLTLVCHGKKVMHRVWAYVQARLVFTRAAFQYRTLPQDGCASRMSAADPATCGDAIDVPDGIGLDQSPLVNDLRVQGDLPGIGDQIAGVVIGEARYLVKSIGNGGAAARVVEGVGSGVVQCIDSLNSLPDGVINRLREGTIGVRRFGQAAQGVIGI